MSKTERKKLKKFIFSNNSVQYPSKEADSKPARKLEWELIRAALAGEPIHWIDGFLIFETWREKDQKGNYLDLFRKVASHVKRELQNSGIEDIEMGHPTGKLDYWILVPNRNKEIASNILDAVSIAQKARNAFCQGQIPEGLSLVQQSYKVWPNAKNLTEALLCAERLPSDLQKYESLPLIRNCLAEYKQNIISALAKITVLGLENKQGIDKELVLLAIDRWGKTLFDINTVLGLLEGKINNEKIEQSFVQEFISLTTQYCEYFKGANFRDSSVEVEIYKKESEQLLQKIINSDFVISAADITRNYYEDIDYLQKYASMVDESLQEAITSFIFKLNFPIDKFFNPFPAFCEHLRKYVKMCFTKDGAKNIFESKDDNFEKKKRMASLIKDVAGSDGLVIKIQKIFDKQGQSKDIGLNSKNLKLVRPKIDIDRQREQNLLSYKYCWPETIYGRNEEKRRLVKFVNHPNENLLWWSIIGKGGSGKSRIALDLCFKLEKKNWYAGFLMDPREIEILSDWKPTRSTLIVIDYAYEKLQKLGECIRNYLYENSKHWDFPVRILILERYAKSGALEQFRRSDPDIIEDNLCYNKIKNNGETGFLELESLGDKAVDLIITEVFKREKCPKLSDEILKTIKNFLKEKVGENNPLYTMILAEACTQNEKLQEWDIGDLLGRHLERTRNIWKRGGFDEAKDLDKKHLNLLTLATMTNGVKIKDSEYAECLKATIDGQNIIDILPLKRKFNDCKYQILCDGEISEELSPMTPDILGEYFILDRCGRGVAEEGEMELLTKIAWQYKPFGMIDFIKRTVIDFHKNKEIEKVIKISKSNEKFYCERAYLLCELINIYCKNREFNKTKIYYDDLDKLKNAHSEDKEVLHSYASSTSDMVGTHSEMEDIEKAVEYYKILEELYSTYEDDEKILRSYTVATSNILSGYCILGKMDRAIDFYDKFEKLQKLFSNDKNVLRAFASALANIIGGFCKSGEWVKAVEFHDKLKNLQNLFFDNNAILRAFSSAHALLISVFCKYGDISMAVRYFEQSKALLKSNQKDKNILYDFMASIIEIISQCFTYTKNTQAIEYYKLTEDLYDSYKDDKTVAQNYAYVLAKMVNNFCELREIIEAVNFHDKLKNLRNSSISDEEILHIYAIATHNLIGTCCEADNLEQAIEHYKILEELYSTYKDDGEIIRLFTISAGHIVDNFSVSLDANKLDIKTLRALVQATTYCLVLITESENMESVVAIYKRIKKVYNFFKSDEKISRSFIWATAAMVIGYMDSHEVDNATIYYKKLKMWQEKYEGDEEIENILTWAESSMI